MKRIVCDCCRNMGHFLSGLEREKDLVNAHLHYIVSSTAVASPKIWWGKILTSTVFCNPPTFLHSYSKYRSRDQG